MPIRRRTNLVGSRLPRRRGARRHTPLFVELLEARTLLAAAPEGLVSWYRADGDVADAAGSNDGVLENGATFTAGKVGQAFLFDGVDDQIRIADDDSQDPGSGFTVEAWVNLSESGHGRTIAQKRTSPANLGGYTLETSHDIGTNGLQFVIWLGGTANFLRTPAGVLTNGTWHHVAATYSGMAMRIFVDGVETASAAVSGVIDDSDDDVIIGRNAVIQSFAWKGAIDEWSFYNRALAQAEILGIVTAGSAGKQDAIVITTAADEDDGSPNSDLGAGTSLREAIDFANAIPGEDEIHFNIPGAGPHTISLLSELSAISDAVTIDGYTQPGASPNTLADGNDAVILIELDGTSAGDGASGLTVAGGGSTIRGLAINRFPTSGIVLLSDDNIVEGNFLGTDVTGTHDRGNNEEGVEIVGPEEVDAFYTNDFEGDIGEEWNTGKNDVTPLDGNRFLGQFGSETVTLGFDADSIDQDIDAITVSFDLYVIRTWDGSHNGGGSGPDRFSLSLGNGMKLLDTTFSNGHPNSVAAGQAYPGVFGTGQFDSRTGAAENNTLGYLFGDDEFDSIYHLSFTFSYTGSDLVLNFTGALTTPGDDESWGLDNVELVGHTSAASAPNDYSLDSNPNGDWTYGWTSSLGGTLHPYPHSFTASGLQHWIDNAIASLGAPATAYNFTALPAGACCTVQPGQLTFHPGPSAEQSVVRWTAPADEMVDVAAFFVGIDGAPTSTDAHVLHNGASLFDGVVNRLYASPYFEATLQVRSGDTIDFAIGAGGNGFFSDSTALDAVITKAAVGAAAGNRIGGTSPAEQNIVAFNRGDGIRTEGDGIEVVIVGNSIFENVSDGIDLDDEIVDEPEIVSLTSFPGELRFEGSLEGEPTTKYRIEFFASDSSVASNEDEGQRLLGVRRVTTDESGHNSFIHELPPVVGGQWITATATLIDTDGETLLATSEFSQAVQANAETAGADLEVTITDSPDPVPLGEVVTFVVTVTNRGPTDATNVVVVARGPAGQEFNSVTLPLGSLPVGAIRSLELAFTPAAVGTFTLTASATASEDDHVETNNTDTEVTQVGLRESDLSVTIAAPTEGFVGEQVNYVATITNHGPQTATGITLETNNPLSFGMIGLAGGLLTQQVTNAFFGTISFGTGIAGRTVPNLHSFLKGTLAPLAPGASATVTIPINLIHSADLSLTVAASELDANLGDNTARATTRANPYSFRLDSDQYTVDESAGTVPLVITRSGSPFPAEVFVYSRNEGSSSASGQLRTVSFAQGQTSAQLDFPIFTEGLATGDLTFEIALSPASPFGTEFDEPSFATVTIVPTPVVLPKFELAQAQYEVREGEVFAVLTVRKLGDIGSSGSVEFTTVNGTAGQRGLGTPFGRIVDFTTTSGELFFRGRQNVATIRVPIGDDAILEGDESFRVVLSNPSAGAELGPISSAEVIIHDNDPTVSFLASSSERNEGVSGRGSIEVRLTPASTQTVTVAYAAAGGSATAGTDYSLVGSSLTFRPGETRKFIQFSNVNDTLFEGPETAFIELSSPTNAFLGTQARHRVLIVDNDPVPPPVDPGGTIATALFIDLQTLPRQAYHQFIGRTELDIFKVELGPREHLALDVDPGALTTPLPNSRLTIFDSDGLTMLASVGASPEPEGGLGTNNAATLFQADADGGVYYVQLSTTAASRAYGYSLGFQRIGVSENVPTPEKLNVAGSMYAWFEPNTSDPSKHVVGITGPTGYGFTLEGPWQHQVQASSRSVMRSQTMTLLPGDRFTLTSPQLGVEIPLLASNVITIATNAQRWGDVVGVVSKSYIDIPMSLDIAPINDLLADVFGSNMASVGALFGAWRISLGGSVYFENGRNVTAPVDEMLAGVPYLRQRGPIKMIAQFGPIVLDFNVIETPIEWIFDPADPMLYVKVAEIGRVKDAALAISMHGLIEYVPQDAPNPLIDAGVTQFYGQIYGTAIVPFQIGPLPMEVEAEVVLNVDADRDGLLLGDLADVADVFDILQGDFSEVREIVNDVQLGANGTLVMSLTQKKGDPLPPATYTMEAGRASVVLDGLEETIWVRGQQGGDVLSPEFLKKLNSHSSVVTEGMINWDGDFLLATTTTNSVAGVTLEYGITFTNDGIFARVTGTIEWSAKIDYLAGTVSGKAKATIEANISIEFDGDGAPHTSGSISARGRLTAKINNRVKELFDDSVSARVRGNGFRFDFPLGVGDLDLDVFEEALEASFETSAGRNLLSVMP